MRRLRRKIAIQTVKTEMTHASTSENNLIFKNKTVLESIEIKHFKTIALNDDLFSEVCNDSGSKNDVILKKKKKNGFSSMKMKQFL